MKSYFCLPDQFNYISWWCLLVGGGSYLLLLFIYPPGGSIWAGKMVRARWWLRLRLAGARYLKGIAAFVISGSLSSLASSRG
jgi:hypothetical protein